MLEAVELALSRQDRLLFEGVSFAAAGGGLVVVEGPNGAGKTSLLRVLAGLTPPESGEVRWDGCDIRRHRAPYARDLAYIGHAPGIKLDLTPEENLRVAVRTGRPGQETADRSLRALGLDGHGDVLCRQLSAGQRRRVALARLLACRARLWILDEPYTALDRSAVDTVNGMIQAHLQAGSVVVMTSHQDIGLDVGNTQRIRLGDA